MLLVQHCQMLCSESLQLCVAQTTGAGSIPVESSYDQCAFVLVRLFLV